jgi:hypothetical protein
MLSDPFGEFWEERTASIFRIEEKEAKQETLNTDALLAAQTLATLLRNI